MNGSFAQPPRKTYCPAIEEGDVVPSLASALLAATIQGSFSPGAEHVKTAVAIVALALPLVCIITNKDQYDWVASTAAPTVLAATALELMGTMSAAALAFGSKLCSMLGAHLDVKASFYALLASLAAAVYYGYGNLWVCSAYVLLSGLRAVRGFRNNQVPVMPVVVTLLLGYAIFDFVQSGSSTLLFQGNVCIILATIAWSAFTTSQQFASELQDK